MSHSINKPPVAKDFIIESKVRHQLKKLYESPEPNLDLILQNMPIYEAKLKLKEELRLSEDIHEELSLIREFIVNYSSVTLPDAILSSLSEYYDSKTHKPETFRLVSGKEKWLSAVAQVLRYLENKAGKHKKYLGDRTISYFPTNLGDKGKGKVKGIKFPSNSDNYGRGGSAILKVLVELGYIERIGNYCNSGGNVELGTSGSYSIPYRFTQRYFIHYYTYPEKISSNNDFYVKQFDAKVNGLLDQPDLLYEFVNQFHFDFELDVVFAAKKLLIEGIGHRDNVEYVGGDLNGLILNKMTAKFISDLFDMDLMALLQVGVDDYSGRFHTKFNQIKKESRKFLKVDEEEVAEIDIKSCQISLLIAESIRVGNLTIEEGKRLTEGDLYTNIGMLVPRFNNMSRSEIKHKVMESLFSLSPNDRTQAWVAKLHPGVFKTLVDIKDIDRDYYNNGKHSSFLPRYLQCMEVEVISRVRSELNRKGVRYVSIFDSIVVPKSKLSESLNICESIKPQFYNIAGIPNVNERYYEIIKWSID